MNRPIIGVTVGTTLKPSVLEEKINKGLNAVVESALQSAKESGAFTPIKGTDYYTEADKAEMVDRVLAALPDAAEVSY